MKNLVRFLLGTPKVWHDAYKQHKMTARLSWGEAWNEVDSSVKEKLIYLCAHYNYCFPMNDLVSIPDTKLVKICDKGIYKINGEIIPVLLCPLRDATTDDIAYIMYRYPDDASFLMNLMTIYPDAVDTLRSKYPDTTEKIKNGIMEFGVNKYYMSIEAFKKLFDEKFWPIYGESKYTPLEIAKSMYLWCLEVHDNESAIKWSNKFNQLKETEDGLQGFEKEGVTDDDE